MLLGRGESAVDRAFWALATGNLMNTTQQTTDQISRGEALIFALTGAHPSRVDTAFDIFANESSLRDLQTRHTRVIQQNFRNMMAALNEGNFDRANQLQRDNQVHLLLGRFRPEQIQALVSRLNRDQGSAVENAYRTYGRQSPQQLEFYTAYQRALEGRRY